MDLQRLERTVTRTREKQLSERSKRHKKGDTQTKGNRRRPQGHEEDPLTGCCGWKASTIARRCRYKPPASDNIVRWQECKLVQPHWMNYSAICVLKISTRVGCLGEVGVGFLDG